MKMKIAGLSCFILSVLAVLAMTCVMGCSYSEKKETKEQKVVLAEQEVKVVFDSRIPLTQKEFESLVESQIQAHPVWVISLEQYATEETKKEIEKFRKEEKGQLMLQIQQLAQEKEQLKATRDKTVADKTAADKIIADLQGQIKKSSDSVDPFVAPASSPSASVTSTTSPQNQEVERLRREHNQLSEQWGVAFREAVAIEGIHGADSKEAKKAYAEADRIEKLRSVAYTKHIVAQYKAAHPEK